MKRFQYLSGVDLEFQDLVNIIDRSKPIKTLVQA